MGRSEYVYRSLPSGNVDEFPAIDTEMQTRGIAFEFSVMPCGGRIYRVKRTEIPKMPTDGKGPYFPGGFSFSESDVWERYRVEWAGTEWTQMKLDDI